MTNKQDFGGAEKGDEVNRGNHGIDALASGDAGATPMGSATSKKTTTPWYLSRTFWFNLAALLSLLIPSVREWLEHNPVDFVTAMGGVNVLLRFITYGKHQISSVDDSDTGTGNGTGNELKSRPLVPGKNDLANSSIAGAGTSDSRVMPGRIKRSMLLTLGALIVLLDGSCSSETAASSSVSLSGGRAVIVHGSSSLVIDRGERKLLWSQTAPEVVMDPVVQATSK